MKAFSRIVKEHQRMTARTVNPLSLATSTDSPGQAEQSIDLDAYHFNPRDYLIDILSRAVANKQDVQVSLDGSGSLAIFPSMGVYYCDAGDEKAFCTDAVEKYIVRVLGAGAIDIYADSQGQGRNFEEILWKASYYASNGRLIDSCEREDVIEINHWPNLTRLPCPDSAVAITALLTRYPTSITLASRILRVPIEEVFSYYSAAYSAGFVSIHNRQATDPDLKPHKDNTMLRQLLAKISQL